MKMFEKGMIGNVEVKNRLAMSPMAMFNTEPDGSLSDRLIEYYTERAKGGYGLIFPSGSKVTTRFEPSIIPQVLNDPHQALQYGILANRVHQYGAKVCAQLTIGSGRVSTPQQVYGGVALKSASATPLFWDPSLNCEPFTIEEIKYLIDEFGKAAKLACDAGVDMVEIHGYGGYLIDQFISSQWNWREDEYGGSMENRLRIVMDLKDAVHQYCGPDYPVILKFTPDHGYEGGRQLEEGIEMLKYLDDKGFAAFHLDYGCWETWYNAVTTVYQKDGVQLFLAKACKDAGIKTPIMTVGKLTLPDMVEKILEEGTADFILHGHQSIADPYWPRKVKSGHYDDIRHCLGCNECLAVQFKNQPIHCAVNPCAGFEKDYALTPAPEKKKVLIIGGGPGGMQAAITAKQRGLDAEIWEKDAQLGGNLRAAGAPEFKLPVRRYLNYLKTQVYKSNVEVKLNKEATAEEILMNKPDAVILAGGSVPVIPKIPGLEKQNVVEATAMLRAGDLPGKNVVVLGGGVVGCETALHLERNGKNVTLVEMMDRLMATGDQCLNNDLDIRRMLDMSSINIMTSAKLAEAEAEAVCVEKDGNKVSVPCDTVVIAVGRKPDKSLEEALTGKIEQVFTIGENRTSPGKILLAVNEAYHTIRLLEDLVN